MLLRVYFFHQKSKKDIKVITNDIKKLGSKAILKSAYIKAELKYFIIAFYFVLNLVGIYFHIIAVNCIFI